MWKMYSFILTTILLLSCAPKDRKQNNCLYTSVKLFKEFDSTLFERKTYDNEMFFEILDKGSNIGARGIYKFDDHKNLRFYAFLLSDSNDYTFSRQYDSLGKVLEKTGNEIIQWYFRKLSKDSVKVTFYLFTINQKYSDVEIKFNTIHNLNIELFKSPIFSNIAGGSTIMSISKLKSKMIYVTGKKMNICTKSNSIFQDSTEIPAEILK